jgi:hypothetical protein
MTAKRHRPRARIVAYVSAVAALVLAVPVGRYAPFHTVALKETTFARPCVALPSRSLERTIGTAVTASEVALVKPQAEVENLFPSVSRTACEYHLGKVCTGESVLRQADVIVATLPNRSQALYRYSFNRDLLHQDSYRQNRFREFHIGGDRAYAITIDDEVLVRVLDGKSVVDMQFHLCEPRGGSESQGIIWPIVTALRLPITTSDKRPSPPRADP